MFPDVLSFAVVSCVIVGLVASLATIGVIVIRVLSHSTRPSKAMKVEEDNRLEHLQQSVDAIAIEVERIAEAQRFSAKLLSERADSTVRRA